MPMHDPKVQRERMLAYQAAEKQRIERMKESGKFLNAYLYDFNFLENRYEVTALSEILKQPDVVGVIRFVELPSFEPERLFTFVYRPASIEISTVVGATALWDSLPQGGPPEPIPFDPSRAYRRSTILALPSPDCPPVLRDWEALKAASANAGSCSTGTFDGIGYRNRLADRQIQSDAEWSTPELPEHAPQIRLIEAYVELLRKVGLYPE